MTATVIQPGTAMMQAPTPDTVPRTTAILWALATGVGVWIIQRFLSAGAKAAIVNLLEPKFAALEEKVEKVSEERHEDIEMLRRERRDDINEIKDAIDKLAERRGLPRPTWRDR